MRSIRDQSQAKLIGNRHTYGYDRMMIMPNEILKQRETTTANLIRELYHVFKSYLLIMHVSDLRCQMR